MGRRFRNAPLDGTLLTARVSRVRSTIKSIQQGTCALAGTTSQTATINSVSLANSYVVCLWISSNTATNNDERGYTRVELTNATTVTGYRDTGTDTATIGFFVVEHFPGVIKSVQAGTLTSTATITAVNTARAVLYHLGYLADATAAAGVTAARFVRLDLTNSTTVTLTRGTGTGTVTAGYQVVEYL